MWPLRSHPPETHSVAAPSGKPDMLAVVQSDEDGSTIAVAAEAGSWHLTMVRTAAEALTAVGEAKPAVIILDRDLAGQDWRLLVRKLVHAPTTPACLILASSVMDDYLFDEVVKTGGFDVIAKPIRAEELQRIGRLAVTYWRNRAGSRTSG